MEDLIEGIELSDAQAEWLTRGLLDLAAVDGVHPNEIELIKEFYAGSDAEKRSRVDTLKGESFDLDAAASAFKAGGPKVVEAFLTACYLLIYADGEHSDEERSRVRVYAEALGIDHGALEMLHTKARLVLLQQLTGIRNRDAVNQVGESMGLEQDDVAKAIGG